MMSDRRPSKYWLSPREGIVYRTLRDAQLGDLEQVARDVITALHLADQLAESDPVAVVRRGVESGTIKGEVVKVTDSGKRDWIDPVIRLTPNTLEYGDTYIVVGPVDVGEDR